MKKKIYKQRTEPSSLTSITKGPRQCNIELLRIIAMFLVLVVHADFLSLGKPTFTDYTLNPIASLTRVLFESFSIICVNIFILISGWFKIKSTLKGVINFLFQCLFISLSIYLIAILSGNYNGGLRTLILDGVFFQYPGFWFIQSYLILYILSPILNVFVEKGNKRTMLSFLLAFYILQTALSTLGFLNSKYFLGGYSPLSFIGLYLLSSTVKLYFYNFKIGTARLFFFISLFLVFIFNSIICFSRFELYIDFLAYSNPLVILESLGLFLIFTRIRIKHNRLLN